MYTIINIVILLTNGSLKDDPADGGGFRVEEWLDLLARQVSPHHKPHPVADKRHAAAPEQAECLEWLTSTTLGRGEVTNG